MEVLSTAVCLAATASTYAAIHAQPPTIASSHCNGAPRKKPIMVIMAIIAVIIVVSASLFVFFYAHKTNVVQCLSDEIPIIESKEAIIGSKGGEVALSDGMRVEVPEGALPGNTEVRVIKRDISVIDPIKNKYCYDIDIRNVSLSKNITLYFPYNEDDIPENVSEEYVSVLYADEDKGEIVPVNATIDTEHNLAIVSTNHLSIWFCIWPISIKAQVPHSKILKVPYYNQGYTEYCWATCFAMLFKYYKDPYYASVTPKVWEIAAYFGIGNEGLHALTFYMGSSVKSIVWANIGTEPERSIWLPVKSVTGLKKKLKNYICQDMPVMLFLKEHMVLVVGYEGDTFIIHDPSRGMYIRKSWDELFNETGHRVPITLAVPASPPDKVSLYTVNIPSGSKQDIRGLTFVYSENATVFRDNVARKMGSEIWFQWDGRKELGYYFASYRWWRDTANQSAEVKCIPDDSYLCLRVEIANADDSPATLIVKYKICASGGEGKYSDEMRVNVPARKVIQKIFNPVKVSKFGRNSSKFYLEVYLKSEDNDNYYIDAIYGVDINISHILQITDPAAKEDSMHHPGALAVQKLGFDTSDDIDIGIAEGRTDKVIYTSYCAKYIEGYDLQDIQPESEGEKELEQVYIYNLILIGTCRCYALPDDYVLEEYTDDLENYIRDMSANAFVVDPCSAISIVVEANDEVYFNDYSAREVIINMACEVQTADGIVTYQFRIDGLFWIHGMYLSGCITFECLTKVTEQPATPPNTHDVANEYWSLIESYV